MKESVLDLLPLSPLDIHDTIPKPLYAILIVLFFSCYFLDLRKHSAKRPTEQEASFGILLLSCTQTHKRTHTHTELYLFHSILV